MISQSSSVGYTIMGRLLTWQLSKRRPLTPCIRRARHKRSLQKRLAVHRALCPSTLIERRREGKDVVEKSVQAIGITAPWRGLWNKTHSKMWGRLQREDCSWSQCFKNHYAQTYARHGFQLSHSLSSHFWTTDSVRSVSPGLKTKRIGLLLSGPKLCSLMKVNFAFPLEIRVPESGREREAQNPRCLRSSVKFPQSVMDWGAMSSAGVGPLCFLRSKVNTAVYQEVLEHFMLPAADQLYGDADFIFQQDLAPAHSAKATSTWFKDHGIPVLNWPANSPDLNP